MTIHALPTLRTRDLRDLLRLSRERMARLVGVSAKTIERWEGHGGQPSRDLVRARLGQLREIAELAEMVYGRDGVAAFVTTPLGEHGGLTPLQLVERGEGDIVLAALASDYEGAGF